MPLCRGRVVSGGLACVHHLLSEVFGQLLKPYASPKIYRELWKIGCHVSLVIRNEDDIFQHHAE